MGGGPLPDPRLLPEIPALRNTACSRHPLPKGRSHIGSERMTPGTVDSFKLSKWSEAWLPWHPLRGGPGRRALWEQKSNLESEGRGRPGHIRAAWHSTWERTRWHRGPGYGAFKVESPTSRPAWGLPCPSLPPKKPNPRGVACPGQTTPSRTDTHV